MKDRSKIKDLIVSNPLLGLELLKGKGFNKSQIISFIMATVRREASKKFKEVFYLLKKKEIPGTLCRRNITFLKDFIKPHSLFHNEEHSFTIIIEGSYHDINKEDDIIVNMFGFTKAFKTIFFSAVRRQSYFITSDNYTLRSPERRFYKDFLKKVEKHLTDKFIDYE